MKKIFFGAFGLLFLVACSGKKEEANDKSLTDYKVKKVNELVGVARIEPLNKIYPLGVEVNGRINQVYAQEGAPLKKGQLILELDNAAENAQLNQSTMRLNARSERLNSLKARIEAIKIKLSAAEVNMKRDKDLADADAGTKQKAFDSETIYNNFKADLAVANAEMREAEASVGELNAEIKYYNELLNKKKIFAPADGMVLSIDVKPGQTISPGTKLLEFAPDGGLIAITEIDELFALKVKPGMKADITSQGTRDVLTTGQIIYCAPFLSKKSIFSDKADNLEDRRVREVRIKIDKPESVLIGSRVECIIKL